MTSEAVDGNEDLPLREYVGFIWIGDEPGVRLSVWAPSGDDAWAQVVAEYGEGHVVSLRNEEDARKPRGGPCVPSDLSGSSTDPRADGADPEGG